jgi:hypothetical protein
MSCDEYLLLVMSALLCPQLEPGNGKYFGTKDTTGGRNKVIFKIIIR